MLGSIVNWSAKFSRGYDCQCLGWFPQVEDLQITVAGVLGDVTLPVDFYRLKDPFPILYGQIEAKGRELLSKSE